MEQSAVVAVFLRVLETFPGLMFMTTNRGSEVDDAIESRCIALITYETLNESDTKLLWKILSKQFGAAIDDKLVEELVASFGCLAGRDIKGLVKLASKFVRKRSVPYSVDLFRQCAQFRGVV
jgi:AAA+ superfamily predicted ATPase